MSLFKYRVSILHDYEETEQEIVGIVGANLYEDAVAAIYNRYSFDDTKVTAIYVKDLGDGIIDLDNLRDKMH